MSIRFLPAALIAVFIALVAVGGAALAFGRGGADSEATDDLLDRAATELGVDSQALKGALSQARSEIADERLQEMLADLVRDEVITQAQSDEASAWLDQKPAVVDELMHSDLLLRFAATSGGDIIASATGRLHLPVFGDEVTGKMADILRLDAETLEEALQSARDGQAEDKRSQAVDDLIAKLVEDGEITQLQGEEIRSWLDAMPEWLGDHGLLLRIFAHGLTGELRAFSTSAVPYLREFEHRFGGEPYRMIPELDELRRGGAPFFFAPEGGTFEFPGFEFRSPEGTGPENRFFYEGPEGGFEFHGEVPPEFDELFDGLNDRFGDRFDFGDLDGLFDRFAPFRLPPTTETPNEDGTLDVVAKDA